MNRPTGGEFLFPAAFIIFSIASCTGTGKPLLPEKPDDPGRTVVVFLGDSLTEGTGVDPSEAFPSLIDAWWRANGIPYTAENLGISGDTTFDVLGRMEGALKPGTALVVLEIGANDLFRGIPVRSIRENITRIVSAVKEAGTRIALVEIKLPARLPETDPAVINDFNAMFAGIASGENIPLIPSLLQPLFTSHRYWQQDGIHPTAEGHRLLAGKLLRDLNRSWAGFR